MIASRLWGPHAFWHPGDMAWQFATERTPGIIRLWDDRAWGWVYQPDTLMLQVDPTAPELAAEVVAWFDDVRTGDAPRVEVGEADAPVVAALVAAGYAEVPDGPFSVDMRCAAAPTEVDLPAGYALRSAADVPVATRVEAHRAAWLPTALPYHPDHQPTFAADATSAFDDVKLARTQTMYLYAAERDFVITTDDGDPAACCTLWFDPDTGAGEIEPLGVAPEHRRRGLARALCRAALDAVATAGGTEVVIFPRGDDAYPAPRAAYLAAGFTICGRSHTYGRST